MVQRSGSGAASTRLEDASMRFSGASMTPGAASTGLSGTTRFQRDAGKARVRGWKPSPLDTRFHGNDGRGQQRPWIPAFAGMTSGWMPYPRRCAVDEQPKAASSVAFAGMTGGRGLSRAEQRMTAREPRLWIPAFAGMTGGQRHVHGFALICAYAGMTCAWRPSPRRCGDDGRGQVIPEMETPCRPANAEPARRTWVAPPPGSATPYLTDRYRNRRRPTDRRC